MVSVQTNMLAVSGAIEAARAGEYGKGFAVVASDIRNLAHDSAANADRIKDLVKAIQDQITVVMKDVEEILDSALKETEKAKVVQEGLNAIEKSMKEVQVGSEEILKSAEEIVVAAGQVKKAIEQIAAAAQEAEKATEEAATAAKQQAQGAEELAQAIEEIAALADELQSMS
jgi:methyl-accepting chemotaxis protein